MRGLTRKNIPALRNRKAHQKGVLINWNLTQHVSITQTLKYALFEIVYKATLRSENQLLNTFLHATERTKYSLYWDRINRRRITALVQ